MPRVDGVRGANTILIPRGVLYGSQLFAKMTNTSSDLMSGPLAGATVFGNDSPGNASLNKRVIQMVFVHNLTLANASLLLAQLEANATGAAAAFPMSHRLAGTLRTRNASRNRDAEVSHPWAAPSVSVATLK